MPNEIKNAAERKLAFRGYPKVLLDRPQMAAFVGTIAGTWGEIDETLRYIFNVVSYGQPSGNGISVTIDELTDDIYDSVAQFGLKTRLDLVGSVIAHRLSEEHHERYQNISTEIRQRARERNELIHAQWHICDEFPDDLIQFKHSKPFRYTPKELEDRLERAVSTRNKIWDFSIVCSSAPRVRPAR